MSAESHMTTDPRFHALDAVRAFALLSGIALHATMSFLPGMREGNWPISDESTSLTLSSVFFVVHIFRMSLFFAIAGFSAHVLLLRLGEWGFVRNRLRRIALPFVVTLPIVTALLIPSFIWAAHQLGITGPPTIKPPMPEPKMPPWMHLWFLYLLLQFYGAWLIARFALGVIDERHTASAWIDRLLARIVDSRLGPVVLAAPTAVVLYFTPWWQMWQGIPTPTMGLVPNFPAVLAFGSAFAFGWYLHRQTGLLETLKRDWLSYIVVATLSSAIALWLIGPRTRFYVYELPHAERIAYAISYNLATWFWVFGLIGAAWRFLTSPNPTWRYFADASFYMYIAHFPIVCALEAAMIRWPLHWSVKYILIVSITTAVLLLSYHYLVRSTFVGQFLSGRKLPRRKPFTSAPNTSPG
jgi:peptidoglycan/LPS O-acetylase OafA/YrhL